MVIFSVHINIFVRPLFQSYLFTTCTLVYCSPSKTSLCFPFETNQVHCCSYVVVRSTLFAFANGKTNNVFGYQTNKQTRPSRLCAYRLAGTIQQTFQLMLRVQHPSFSHLLFRMLGLGCIITLPT